MVVTTQSHVQKQQIAILFVMQHQIAVKRPSYAPPNLVAAYSVNLAAIRSLSMHQYHRNCLFLAAVKTNRVVISAYIALQSKIQQKNVRLQATETFKTA